MKTDKIVEETTSFIEDKYKTLFETNRDSITIFRIDNGGKPGNFIEVNPATTALFGYTKEELLDLTIGDIETLSDKKRKARTDALLSKGRIDFETIIKNKKGNLRNVEIKTQLINYLNEPAVMNITRDISEKKQLENNIKNTNESLTTILDAIPDLLFEVDLEGNIYHYQAHREDLLAAPPSEIIGKNFQDIMPVDATNTCFSALKEANKKGWSTGKQYSLHLPQGKCWFELSISPIKESSNKDKHFIVLARDITERNEAEEKLKFEKERIRTILELVGNPIFLKDNEHRFTYANSSFCTLFGLDQKSIIGKTLAENIPENEIEHFFRIDRKVLDTGITDIGEETLTMKGNLHTFITSKTRFIDAAGNKSVVGSSYDITELKKTEEKLKFEKERIRTILELVGNPIFLKDNEHKITFANTAFCNLFGLDEKNVLGKTLAENVRKSEQEHFLRIDRNVLDTGIPDIREEELTLKGITHTIITSKTRIIDAEGNKTLVVSIYDITERKKAEEALQKSQEKLRGVFDLANSGIILTDLKGKYLLFNNWCTEVFGFTRQEFNKLNRDDLTHPDDLEKSNLFFNKLIEGKINRYQIEKRYVKKDKSIFWVELSVSAIKDKNGKVINTIGILNDITERKDTDEKLKQSEARLITAQSVAKIGSWETDFSFTNAIWSDETRRIFGLNPGATELSLEAFLGIVHPEDRLMVETTFVHSIKSNIVNSLEHRVITAAGIEKTVEERWEILRDYQGQPIRAIGTCQDITERKLAEELILQGKTRFSSIINSSPVAMALNDENLNITYLNHAFVAMFGYTLEEIPTIQDWFPKAYPEPKYRIKIADAWITELEKVKQTGKEFIPMEVIIRCKNGSDKTVMVSANPLLHSYISEYLINFYDITERKQAEEALENEKRRLAVILIGTDAGTWEWNIQTGATIFNERWAEIIGYTLDELSPISIDTWIKFTHPDDLIKSNELLEKCFNGELDFYENENRMKHKNGDWVWVIVRGKINEWDIDGKPLYMSGTHLDITERKLAESALLYNMSLTEATLDSVQNGILAVSSKGNIIKANTKFAEMWKIPNKILNSTDHKILLDFVLEQLIDPEEFINKVNKLYAKPEAKSSDILYFKDGRIFERISKPMYVEGKTMGRVWSFLDITERKLAEKAKEDVLNLFNNITSHVPGVVYQYLLRPDGSSCFPYASEGIRGIYGVTPEEAREDASKVFANIHPDDYEAGIASIQKSAKYLTPWKHEYCVKFNDGEIRHLYGDAKPQRLEDGSVLWHGYITDITEKKIIENSLRESEEKYRGLIENSPDGILIYIDEKITFINDEGIRMLGAKNKEELIGKHVLQFAHPDSIKNIVEKMEEINQNKFATATVEEKLVTLDGVPFDAEIKAIPTLYEHKTAVQVIIHDITLRKQNSLELSKINRVYALISQINNLIIRTRSQEELFQEICNIAVNFGKFRMSWIGLVNQEHKILTSAFAGYEEGYFTQSNITTTLAVPEGRGPTGIALREGRTVICNDITKDKMMKPWRKDALDRGYHSVISIPIIVRNKIIGAFNLYSQETNFFSSEEEISLLEKIILNISFALEAILIEDDRKRTEVKIRQLSQAVEQSPVTIVITNTKGDIEYANPKFIETTGYTLEEVIGQNPRVLKSGHTSPDEYKKLWQTIGTGKEWHGEFHNKKKDGSLFWESATISPIINSEGKTTYYIAIKEDITRRKNTEEELIQAKLHAEESDRLKLAFLANMSHEIRTPMNGILGFTELLKEPHLTGEEQQEYINIIEKSGKRMLNIINDIINISKVESGQIEISLSETNVNEQIEYIHAFFIPETKQKGIQLFLSKKLALKNNFINTDREKLYAILTNLVKNAIKFTNKGFIEIGCEIKGKNLEFFVKDSGMGISKSQQKIVFERFRQANDTITRSHEGSGLGLAISKAYVEMLGGKIWVESEERKGSTFYFTIPFCSEYKSEEKNVAEKVASVGKEENTIKDLKVLIVEDDAISKLLITIAVKPYSKEIMKVSTGFEAIDACRNIPDIDLVMMDINMPEMGGYEATKLIREFNKDLIIIAQTANGMQSDRDNAIAAGCTDYISKPINITDLGALIQKYFKK
jgi:PAS domain S-box-containing protein